LFNNPEAAKLVLRLRAGTGDIETVIRELRAAGFSKGESIVAIAEVGVADLGEATRLVHESLTWADRRNQDAAFNHAFWQELASNGQILPDGSIDLTSWLKVGNDDEG